ncbi:MmgE/PrpD family protein [Amycolatopsis alkalitolerans]|nr:MmgE/PrpD family protein [Amycolatopsis alkalitolerans]
MTTDAAVTRTVAQYVRDADLGGASEAALDQARRTLVDTVAVAVAGGREPAVRIVRDTVATGPDGPAQVLADGSRATAADAALLGAVAGHALDYDDVVDHIYGHPSVVLWPAVLAAGQSVGATERQIIEAYLAGFDVQMALAEGIDVRRHYARGWHSTATLGVVAAAAGVARLLCPDVESMAHALGVAASMAGGSRQNFGTMTKPLHAGLAARDGVLAAVLAADGFTADESQLEGPLGFFALYDTREQLAGVTAALGAEEPGAAILRRRINVKRYPACYNTQRMSNAALDLFNGSERAADIKHVQVTVEPGGLDPLIHHRPRSGLEGKFSAEYVVAAALLDGRLGLDTYTDAAVTRPEVQALAERVDVTEQRVPPRGPAEWDQAYAVIRVELADGSVRETRVDVPRGDCRAPLSDAELEAKLKDCVSYSGMAVDPGELSAELFDFGSGTVFTGFAALEP